MSIRHITAGGGVLVKVVNDEPLVLLIFRRGVWDLPKGKKEEDETTEQCALREVAEEVGCPMPENLGKLAETYHEYTENGQKVGKTTHWFLMKTASGTDFEPEHEEGIEKVHWFYPQEAIKTVGYDNLVSVLEAFLERQNESK